MADPKTPFWKRFTVTKTKNPISSTKPPARLGVVITPEKTVGGLSKTEWIFKNYQTLQKTFRSKSKHRPSVKLLDAYQKKMMETFFENAYKQEQGTYKRATPKRKPINYNTMKETSKWMNTKPTKQNFWQRRIANTKFNPKTGIKLLKIGKSLTPLGLGGTALWYGGSKAYEK